MLSNRDHVNPISPAHYDEGTWKHVVETLTYGFQHQDGPDGVGVRIAHSVFQVHFCIHCLIDY